MAEAQPSSIVEGASTGDVDDEVPVAAKSAEDRKVAGALSKLDAREDESAGASGADQEAMKKALAGISANGSASKEDDKKVVKKNVKVDPADVALLIEELELTKPKATDLLKAHDGNVKEALTAYLQPPQPKTISTST